MLLLQMAGEGGGNTLRIPVLLLLFADWDFRLF